MPVYLILLVGAFCLSSFIVMVFPLSPDLTVQRTLVGLLTVAIFGGYFLAVRAKLNAEFIGCYALVLVGAALILAIGFALKVCSGPYDPVEFPYRP